MISYGWDYNTHWPPFIDLWIEWIKVGNELITRCKIRSYEIWSNRTAINEQRSLRFFFWRPISEQRSLKSAQPISDQRTAIIKSRQPNTEHRTPIIKYCQPIPIPSAIPEPAHPRLPFLSATLLTLLVHFVLSTDYLSADRVPISESIGLYTRGEGVHVPHPRGRGIKKRTKFATPSPTSDEGKKKARF